MEASDAERLWARVVDATDATELRVAVLEVLVVAWSAPEVAVRTPLLEKAEAWLRAHREPLSSQPRFAAQRAQR
jgi:hypothetical protein